MCAIDRNQLLHRYWELQHMHENTKYTQYKFIWQLLQKVLSYIPDFWANHYEYECKL